MQRFQSAYQAFVHQYQDNRRREGYVLFYLVLPFFLVFFTETISSHSLSGGFQFILQHPYAYLVNVSMLIATLTISLLFVRRMAILLLILFVWFALGVVNAVVLLFRVTPFTGSDLMLIQDGRDIITKYMGPLQIIGILLLIILVVVIIGYLIFITPKEDKLSPLYLSIPSILVSIAVTPALIIGGIRMGYLETEFRELAASYQKNGFYYCFAASVVDVGIRKPSDFSIETIEELKEQELIQEESDSEAETSGNSSEMVEDPNIVIVQLESFFNVNRLKNTLFSENPLPNLTDCLLHIPSGLLSVPVVGAGTVNSEFEVLTGMNIDDFGIGEYPFKTIVKQQPCESIAYLLKNYGYHTFAIHNNTGDFYERNQVYCNLGFDVFTSVEYMWPDEYTPMDWPKDSVLVDQIQTALNSTREQDLVYAVSVQGHGSYPEEDLLGDDKAIQVLSCPRDDEGYLNQLSYYVNQLYEMDQFIADLMEMLEIRNEPTILLMYGDHLPSLDLTDDDLSWGNLYQTEYFIWNNCNLSFQSFDREAYTISSELLAAIGITDGAFNSYHQNSKASIFHGMLNKEDYLNGLKDLEYDILYGDNIYYQGENPYEPTDMSMGFYPIAVTDASLTKDHVMVVKGWNFTRYSRVLINDSEQETLYLDQNTLVVGNAEITEDASIVVSQNGLSESEPWTLHLD